MYRLTGYALLMLVGLSIIYSILGLLPFNPIFLIVSFVIIIICSYISNKTCQKIFKLPVNQESWFISALILFLIISPPVYQGDIFILILASIMMTCSKYFFTIRNQHIFNPVAIALLAITFFGFGNSIWWIGSAIFTIPVTVLGLFIVRKLRYFQMFFMFLAASIATTSFLNIKNNLSFFESIYQVIVSWPTIFLGAIMLTEPSTAPSTNFLKKIYGGIVGLFYGLEFSFGHIHSSPEIALLIGNIFSYIASSKQKVALTFIKKIKIARNTYEFIFKPSQKLKFIPGQYLEVTLNAKKNDSRGNRRYFTISSSPTKSKVRFGVKFADKNGSSFKDYLINLKHGNKIIAGNLSGDFVMPNDKSKQLVFVAGGIGITPFISMIRYLIDTRNEKRNITLFYLNNTKEDISYKNTLQKAKQIGIKTVFLLTDESLVPKNWNGEIGYLDEKIIKKYAPGYKTSIFYLSGPNAMVDNYKNLLLKIGISKKQIKTDYFPGF